MEKETKIELSRLKELNENLYEDVVRLGDMFSRYATLVQRAVKIKGLKIDVDGIVPIIFERENKYDFEDDGNTHADGLEIQCGWLLPLIGGREKDFEEGYNYINLSPLVDGMYMEDERNGYVSLTYNAYIRVRDGRYKRQFTSLYYRKPGFSIDMREMQKAHRITYINNNYDKDAIFMDLKSCSKLCGEIAADYLKGEEYLKIVELSKSDDINLYVPKYY